MNLAVLSLAAARDKHKLSSTTPWLILVDFCWQGQHVRVVRDTQPRTFDAGDGAGPQTYQPLAFEITSAQTTSDGSLPQISLKVSNVNRIAEGAIVQYQGAVGATANLYVVNTDNPSGEPDLAISTTIMRTTTSPAWLNFTLSAVSPLRQLFPRFLYYQGTCMWQYRGAQCLYAGITLTANLTSGLDAVTGASTLVGLVVGMIVTGTGVPGGTTIAAVGTGGAFTLSDDASASGSAVSLNCYLPTCSLTYEGANGCLAHGNQQRFGGFPGIGTNGASIAGQV